MRAGGKQFRWSDEASVSPAPTSAPIVISAAQVALRPVPDVNGLPSNGRNKDCCEACVGGRAPV
jgi:hypothetical protein